MVECFQAVIYFCVVKYFQADRNVRAVKYILSGQVCDDECSMCCPGCYVVGNAPVDRSCHYGVRDRDETGR